MFHDPDGDDNFAFPGLGINYLMTVDSAPGWYVVFHARVCTGHRQQVSGGESIYFVLGPDHGHRAEQPASVKRMFRHTSSRTRLLERVAKR